MDWTREQREAITTTGKNILVSAAAGSGKTTVLIERIKNLVLNEGVDIDRFLITTFTKAAAAEMKQRLEEAIRKEMRQPGANRKALAAQLQLLPMASIGTFHSFAIDVIRQYFYLTDLEPGFEIGDDVQMTIMKNNAINEVFRRRYEEGGEEFSEFILKYSGSKGDGGLKENILDTYKTLTSIPDYFNWAEEKAEILATDSPMEGLKAFSHLAKMGKAELKTADRYYREAADSLDREELPSNYKTAQGNADIIEAISKTAARSLVGEEEELKTRLIKFREILSGYKLTNQTLKKEKADQETQDCFEAKRKKGKEAIDRAKNLLGIDFDSSDGEMKEVYGDTLYYIGLIREFVETFKAMKAGEKVIDYDDIMHYALEVLKDEGAASELREKFDYIFIDEYQDSNYLQEVIVGRIARENNLFMVGDVKQCIYKFRLAEPELFMEKAKSFGMEDSENSILINLNKNYRSKINITEPVNRVFTRVMEGYDEAAQLNCTAPEDHPGFPARIHIVERENFADDSPNKGDAEARVIADIIRERLGQPIFDTKENVERPLRFRDFAVIARNNRTVENIERYLNNEGIAAYGEGSGKYFETVEVQVFLNLLRIIINMRQDVPLISAMKSVIFGFEISQLAKIRIENREGSFYSAVMKYAEDGSDETISEKILEMLETVNLWKEKSRTMPLEELVKTLLYDTGYYDYCSGLPVGNQRISNLRLIVDKASRFEKISYGGLFGFLRYIESMEDSGQNEGEAKIIGEKEDVVRIMSVHKSKGLEFPIVILANASGEITGKGSRHRINIHRELGIGLPKINTEEHWHKKTYLQKMINDELKRESLEEEIRILYVALTRAKDGLEIVGTIKNSSMLDTEVSVKTFLSMIYGPFREKKGIRTIFYNNPDQLSTTYSANGKSMEELYARADIRASEEDENTEFVKNRLSYEYAYGNEAAVKPKYSVSELNRKEAETAVDISVAEFPPEISKGRLSAAQVGTIMHLIMEKVDFVMAVEKGKEYIQSVADDLLAEESISEEEYDAVNVDNICRFFETDMAQRCASASRKGKLYKEQEFIASKEIEGVETVVQGIIDCYFEEDDRLVLIDYKNSFTGNRTEDEIATEYSGQLALYKEALESATGLEVAESYLYLFETGTFIKS